jgi:TRAP-type C4-dicarboxylate transport system permease small subunit
MNSTPLFDRIIDLLASLAGGLILFMMLSICIDVVLRYFLNRPLTWGVEISEYILLWSTLLSVAWVLKIEGHVKIDLVVNRLNPRNQCLVNTITSILGAITRQSPALHPIPAEELWIPKELEVAIKQRGLNHSAASL